MRILINASILKAGGGIQVAHSFINELKEFCDNKYGVVATSRLFHTLKIQRFPENFRFYTIGSSPSDVRKGLKAVKRLKQIEAEFKPDIVFTVFGPSYWKPEAIHVCGYALPHFIYPDSPFFDSISLTERFRLKILEFIKLNSYTYCCDHLITETEDVASRLAKKLKVSSQKISTVTNAYNAVFDSPNEWKTVQLNERHSLGFKLVTISAPYKHKNLSIIPLVVDYLNRYYPDFNFTFILTVDRSALGGLTKQQAKHIVFLGPIAINECPDLYQKSDALFMPTLLECFTVSYLEAMAMKKPILTSDLSFAHGICQEAAYYFNPRNVGDIGDKIVSLATDHQLQLTLIEHGIERLKHFGTAADRARSYLSLFKELAQNYVQQPNPPNNRRHRLLR